VKLDPHTLRAHLARFSLLEALDAADLGRLAAKVSQRRVSARQPVFCQGECGDELFLLLSGTVRIVLEGLDGREVTLALFSQGQFFGDMALLDGGPRSASAIAVDDCELLVLQQSYFFEFLVSSPKSLRRLVTFLSVRLRRSNQKLLDVSLLTLRQRLAGLLRDLALRRGESDHEGILLPRDVNHRVLAEMLSTTRESVSRGFAELRIRGLVAQAGRRIRVLDAEGLRELLEGPGRTESDAPLRTVPIITAPSPWCDVS